MRERRPAESPPRGARSGRSPTWPGPRLNLFLFFLAKRTGQWIVSRSSEGGAGRAQAARRRKKHAERPSGRWPGPRLNSNERWQ